MTQPDVTTKPRRQTAPVHVLGLDLGQVQDPSALALVERTQAPPAPPAYAVRHLQRWPLGTPYTTIAADAAALAHNPALHRPRLAVDQTGVGRAVLELVAAAVTAAARAARTTPVPVRPILITSGHAVTYADGSYRVPKKELVSALQAALSSGRLKVAADLPLARALAGELKAFKAKITAAGHETFEAWRERDHDDLVLAVAMAVWLAAREPQQSGAAPRLVGA